MVKCAISPIVLNQIFYRYLGQPTFGNTNSLFEDLFADVVLIIPYLS